MCAVCARACNILRCLQLFLDVYVDVIQEDGSQRNASVPTTPSELWGLLFLMDMLCNVCSCLRVFSFVFCVWCRAHADNRARRTPTPPCLWFLFWPMHRSIAMATYNLAVAALLVAAVLWADANAQVRYLQTAARHD